MFVYLSVMILCCILLYAMRNDKNKIKPLAIVFSMIWLMVSLQEGWGGDYDSYQNAFDWLKGQSFSNILADDYHGEVGYKILMSLMPSTHAGLVLGMAIWCFSMAFLFYHFIPQKWWFLAILFVFFDRAILMGMVASFLRMALANSLLVFAFYYVLKDKRLLGAALIIIGSFFHRSVLFMLPLVLLRAKKSNINTSVWIIAFVIFTIFFMVSPTSWIDFVEMIVLGVEPLEKYSIHFDNEVAVQMKGLVLVILFYWIYVIVKQITAGTNDLPPKNEVRGVEYLMMYLALVRIAFDILPAMGLSTRFFYYIDIYFFAGMMWVMNRLPQKSPHRYGLVISLLLMFWILGFRAYSKTEFFLEHWDFYNFIF